MIKKLQTNRLFVALWPDSQALSEFSDLQIKLQLDQFGKPTDPTKLHLTLLFLGDVPVVEIPSISTAIQAIKFEPFLILFDKVDFWPRNQILWAGCEQTVPELNDLANVVRGNFDRFSKRSQRFIPHLTLARKFRRRIRMTIEPIEWKVDRCELVQSKLTSKGAQYRTIARSN